MYSPYLYSRVKTFVNTYGSGVAKAIAGTGLFFPAVMGQSIFESGYGDKIPKGSNNFGGIKYNPNLAGVIGYVDVYREAARVPAGLLQDLEQGA